MSDRFFSVQKSVDNPEKGKIEERKKNILKLYEQTKDLGLIYNVFECTEKELLEILELAQ